ncbi:hypothetical protein V6Z12_A03G094500 [Gossypium hirsutum]
MGKESAREKAEAEGATLSFPSCRPYLVTDYFSNKSCKYLITIFPLKFMLNSLCVDFF